MLPRRQSDLASLHSERKESTFPLSKTPFVDVNSIEFNSGNELKEVKPGELRVTAPEEVPWIDLLLEISMTTAFASLTDGTPILQWNNAVSYLSFFVFVWWIWVSQVAYNMRFRQQDWAHRFWVFVQLIIFSALAAFTDNFDITTGLFSDPNAALQNELLSELGNDHSRLAAMNFRDDRMPRVNARGISMVMALSRMLLLGQYIVVFYHAKGLSRSSLYVHMGPLLFSALCYIGAFIALGSSDVNRLTSPIQAVEITKLVLWYLPIIVELVSHFVALHLPGFVSYSTESIYARNASLFIIILGGGLDKITGGFKAFVGNLSARSNATLLLVASAAIFVCLFSLYFGTPGSQRELGNRRRLAWFFSQVFFLAPLLLTLQAMGQALQFSHLVTEVQRTTDALAPVFTQMRNNGGMNLTVDMFPDPAHLFATFALPFEEIIAMANVAVEISIQQNDSRIIDSFAFQETMDVIYNIVLAAFNAQPENGSLLWAKVELFLITSLTNTTEINDANFYNIWSGIIEDRGSSVLWLFPSAGGTILALVVMSLIKGLPRDKWEWAIIGIRSFFGTGICLLTLLDVGAWKDPVSANATPSGSKIWSLVLAQTPWPLIIVAIAMIMLQIISHLIAWAANRTYFSLDHLFFWKRRPHPSAMYRTGFENDTLPLTETPLTETGFRSSMDKSPDSMYGYSYDAHESLDHSQDSAYHVQKRV